MSRLFIPPDDIRTPPYEPYASVHIERIRAHDLHNGRGESMERKVWNDQSWIDVLGEEYGEVCRVRNELRHGNITVSEAMGQLRKELIQTAAMTLAWVDAIDGEE
jgi:hypothetical protein